IVAKRVHMDVLMDQLDGLGAKRMPDQLAVTARRLDRLVHLRQPPVVLLVLPEDGIGGDGLPKLSEEAVLTCEIVAHGVVREALLRSDQSLVAFLVPIYTRKERETFLHRNG